MLVMFARSRYAKAMFSVLPIAIVPLGHIVASGVIFLSKGQLFGVRGLVVIAFADALALGLACALIVHWGKKIEAKLSRRLYYIVMIGYSVIIGWVYIFTTLKPLLV